MRILVTGAGGLIGNEVVERLRSAKLEAIAVTRATVSSPRRIERGAVSLDLRSQESIAALTALRPDVIVHAAAVLPLRFDDHQSTLAGEQNRAIDDTVIAAGRSLGCRLIYLSSTSLYGCVQTICTEDSPISPRGPYGKEKRDSETEILNLDGSGVVLRVSAPYGSRQRRPTVLRKFVGQAVRGEDLLFYGSGAREQDFTAVQDVATAVMAAVREKPRGIFNIASGRPISMRNLASLVIEVVRSRQSRARTAGVEDPEETCRARIAITKAERELRWHPEVRLEDGIRQLAFLSEDSSHFPEPAQG